VTTNPKTSGRTARFLASVTAAAAVEPSAFREALSFEDRALLELRVDRQLGFREIAYFLAGAELDVVTADRETERLHERFRLLQERLRAARARRRGWGRRFRPRPGTTAR
jgi:hypothetical protein